MFTIITNNLDTIESIKLNTDVDIKIVSSFEKVQTKYYAIIPKGICNTVELCDVVEFLRNNEYSVIKVPYLQRVSNTVLEKQYTNIINTKPINNLETVLEIDYFYAEL